MGRWPDERGIRTGLERHDEAEDRGQARRADAPGVNDAEASRAAQQSGIVAEPLSELYLETPRQNGLLLGYTGLTPARIRDGVHKLAAALRSPRPGHSKP
jgi:hypothetical protein